MCNRHIFLDMKEMYTQEDHERWATLYRETGSTLKVAKLCGVPSATVVWRLREMGVTKGHQVRKVGPKEARPW